MKDLHFSFKGSGFGADIKIRFIGPHAGADLCSDPPVSPGSEGVQIQVCTCAEGVVLLNGPGFFSGEAGAQPMGRDDSLPIVVQIPGDKIIGFHVFFNGPDEFCRSDPGLVKGRCTFRRQQGGGVNPGGDGHGQRKTGLGKVHGQAHRTRGWPDHGPIGIGQGKPDSVARLEVPGDFVQFQGQGVELARVQGGGVFMALMVGQIEHAIAHAGNAAVGPDIIEPGHETSIGLV